MTVQSFNLPVDFFNNLEKPIIYIAKKDKTFLGAVSIYDDLSLTFNLNAYQTASFKIYRNINGKKYEHYDDFQEDRLIMIQGISWYKIHVETNIEDTGISKSITANSLECTLCNKRLIDFECNTGEILYDDYVKTIFYNPANPKGSLLNRVLNVAPSWSVGHVDATLANKQRSFDEDDIDVYSFLTGDVSEAFNCLFIFDTFNQTVNAYDLDNYGEDTSIYVSMDNLAQSMTESIDENSIITCYRVNGGDGIYINEVNPNSTNKIYNFEYYLPEMEESIQNKVKAYNEKYQSLKPQYEEIMKRLGDQIGVIQDLETRLPDSLDSKDWTKYGLEFLDSKVKSFKNIDEVYCAQGMNKPDSFNYNLYQQNLEDLNNVTAEYNKRKTEVDSATDVYNSIIAERNAVQSQLNMDKWFTKDEWKTLDSYVVEETYSNDNYITTDNTTDTERFDIERQLFDVAWKDLSKKCRPQYQYSSTLSNVLTIPQFEGFLKYFQLGNFIRMATDYDTVIKLRLISFTVNYNDTSKIDVVFSDAIRVHDIYDDAASIQAQANSAAMSFQFNKDQYDKSVNESNFVAEMRKYGLDVATTQIHNSKNQSQVWDESGMTFRMWNDERQDFDPEQIKIINNQIVFSDDGFQSAKMAIGKIPIDKNGNTVYAVNAEAILGKLFLGEYLTLQNQSGTYKFDDAGFIASSGKNSVKIQPNQSGELFSIYKGSNKQVYINSDGDVEFAGSLKSASGQFAGLVSGGSIDINNVFQVDKDGKMTATSCNITGNISSSNITSSSATFGDITLNNEGISSTYFKVDSSGAYIDGIINAGEGSQIGGWTITNGKIYGGDSFTGVAVMQKPSSNTTYVFAAGGKNHNSYADCPFRVTKDGKLYASRGKISEFNITDNGLEWSDYGTKIWANTIKTSYLTATDSGTVLYIGETNKKTYIYGKDGLYVNDTLVSLSGHTHNYITNFSGDKSEGVYNSIYTSDQIIYGSKISYSDLKDKVSDIRMKNSISEIKDITSLYMDLKPVEYRYNKGVGYEDNLQFGVIAQWTQNELLNHGYNDCGLVRGSKPLIDTDEANYIDDDVVLRVDYSQFHALHMKMIQKHEQEIISLKQEIKDIKERIK